MILSAYSPTSKNVLSDSAQNWLATGKFGTTNCVLRFSLAAFKNSKLWQTPDDTLPITTAPTSHSNKPQCGNTSKALEPKNDICFANHHQPSASRANKSPLFPDKILQKKRAHESLSSSDTSLASSFEDGAEMEDQQHVMAAHKTRTLCDKVENVIAMKPGNAAPGKENRVSSNDTDLAKCELFEMPAMRLRINYRFANTETKLLRRILNSHGLQEVDESKEVHLLWSGAHVKTDVLRNLKPYQRVNHFPR